MTKHALSPIEIDRLRRSVAMLAPDHPSGLNREAALRVLTELERLQRRDRRVTELLAQVQALLNDEQDDRRSSGPPLL